MGDQTGISWTDSTWNPWRGCDKVSPGCAHCYMFRDQHRYGRDPSVVIRTAPGTFNAPLSAKWAKVRDECLALRGRHLVFTCSWSDWFHEDADPWRDEAWKIIRHSPLSTFQILTKRPERIADHLPADWGDGYQNVWLGVSVENRRFVHRADLLRAIPAAVRFVSAEPLLGPLLSRYRTQIVSPYGPTIEYPWLWEDGREVNASLPELDLTGIHWVIVGGESGSHRVMEADWARGVRNACQRAHVAFHFKQWGGSHSGGSRELDGIVWDEFPAVVPNHSDEPTAVPASVGAWSDEA